MYGTFFIYHMYGHFARILDACLHAELAFRFALHRIRLTREKSPKMCGAGSAPLTLTMM
jgi:hypothetical protein